MGLQQRRRLLRIGTSILCASLVAPASCFLPPSPRASRAASAASSARVPLSEGKTKASSPSPSDRPRRPPPGLSDGDDAGTSSSSRPPRRAGRRSASDRPRRPPPGDRSAAAPRRPPRGRGASPTAAPRKRAPHQFDHTKADARPFLGDPAAYVRGQSPNEDAPRYVFPDDDEGSERTAIPEGSHIGRVGLDDLFPGLGFSEKFCSAREFREALRNAVREDVFDSTPTYAGMSAKVRAILLLPDSSLQGSWSCRRRAGDADAEETDGKDELRMKKLTKVLKEHLGEAAPTGDEFMETVGGLCGSKPSTHWIDIVGITDRKITHSWHQDTGRSPGGDTRTVLLGFPKEDDYDGVGVFSHAVNLKYERTASEERPGDGGDPVVYPKLTVDDEYIVKPRFARGREIITFRDIDSIHSAPDVAYRASVMRFM